MPCGNKRLLLTGATGLIGRELAEPLAAAGFEVWAITIDEVSPDNGFKWIRGSLFDESFVEKTVADVRPTHLLNLAWATTGDYLTNDVNYRFLSAGESLARSFVRHGGRRAVYAGTCFEYKFKDDPIGEDDPLDAEKNAYTHCKNALREAAQEIFKEQGVSFAFGRIFYAFGRGEAKTRLTGLVLDKLRKGESVEIKSGPLEKDYIYSRDIAAAFVALLDANAEGAVNICSGRAVTIRDFALTLAEKLGRPDLVVFNDDCAGQPRRIVGDARRLRDEVGYSPKWSLGEAMAEIAAYSGQGERR